MFRLKFPPVAILKTFVLMAGLFLPGVNSSGQPTEDYPEYAEALHSLSNKEYFNALRKLDLAIEKSLNYSSIQNSIFFKLEKSKIYNTIGQYDSAISLLNSLLLNANQPIKVDSMVKARIHFELGINYLQKVDLEESRKNLLTAIYIYENLEDNHDTLIAPCFNKLGNYYYFKKQYDSALICYQNAYSLIINRIEDYGKILPYLVNLGIGYCANSEFNKSEDFFLKALQLVNTDSIADDNLKYKVYLNLGKFYYDLSDFNNSLNFYNKAENVIKNYLYLNPLDKGAVIWNKSLVYYCFGDVIKASQYMHEARLIFEKKFAKDNAIISALNMDQALIYESLGLREEAVELYRKSLINAALPVKLKTYRNLAKLFLNSGDLAEAGQYFDSCFQIVAGGANISPLEVAYTELYYGDYLISKKDKAAIKHLNSSFEIFINIFGIKHRDVANVLSMMGDHYLCQDKIDLALYYYHQSIISISPLFYNAEILSNPLKEQASIDQHSIFLFEKKALALWMVFEETNDIRYLESLIDLYDLMIYTIEQFIRLYRTEDGRILLSTEFHDIYKSAVQANIVAFDFTKRQLYAEKAFELSEKSKSAILLAELKDENAKKLGMVPEHLLKLEKTLRGNLYLYKKNIIEEEKKEDPNEGKLTFMRSKMFQDEKRYDSLINIYENDFPEYFRLKYDPGVVAISSLQELLDNQEVIIEYTITGDYLIIFLITKTNFRVYKNNLDTLMVSQIFKLRNNLDIPRAQYYQLEDFRQFQLLSNKLYQTLIRPVHHDITGTNVIIIPDEELAYLSFETLTEYCLDPDTIDFKGQPYLLHKYSFSYDGSATLYSLGSSRKNPELRKGILSMAPTYPFIDKRAIQEEGDFGGVIDLNRNLPGAMEEAEHVLEYIQGHKLSGEEATESAFKQLAADYDILHFAMHTWIDDSNPLSSRFSFYPFGETGEDNILHTYEIYNMRLNGHLAVLSACSTGSGALLKGEGVMSLARAFAFAGMPSIIMTLWDVEDLASRQIIPGLYYLLSLGFRKDDALRHAKLNHLKSVEVMIEAHPAFWAGHVLYGNKKPFRTHIPLSFIILLAFLGSMIIFISIMLYVKFRNFKKSKHIQIDLPGEFRTQNRI